MCKESSLSFNESVGKRWKFEFTVRRQCGILISLINFLDAELHVIRLCVYQLLSWNVKGKSKTVEIQIVEVEMEM